MANGFTHRPATRATEIRRRYVIDLEVLVPTIHRPLAESDQAWNSHPYAGDTWSVAPGEIARVASTHREDEPEVGIAESLGMFDFDELDIREFDGVEPEMAELVL